MTTILSPSIVRPLVRDDVELVDLDSIQRGDFVSFDWSLSVRTLGVEQVVLGSIEYVTDIGKPTATGRRRVNGALREGAHLGGARARVLRVSSQSDLGGIIHRALRRAQTNGRIEGTVAIHNAIQAAVLDLLVDRVEIFVNERRRAGDLAAQRLDEFSERIGRDGLTYSLQWYAAEVVQAEATLAAWSRLSVIAPDDSVDHDNVVQIARALLARLDEVRASVLSQAASNSTSTNALSNEIGRLNLVASAHAVKAAEGLAAMLTTALSFLSDDVR